MLEQSKPTINHPSIKSIPYVVVRLANGQLALRHPDEVGKVPGVPIPGHPKAG